MQDTLATTTAVNKGSSAIQVSLLFLPRKSQSETSSGQCDLPPEAAKQDLGSPSASAHPCPVPSRPQTKPEHINATRLPYLHALYARNFTTTLDQSAGPTPLPPRCFGSINLRHPTTFLLCALDQPLVAMAATFQPTRPEDVANKVLRRAQVSKVCALCCDNCFAPAERRTRVTCLTLFD